MGPGKRRSPLPRGSSFPSPLPSCFFSKTLLETLLLRFPGLTVQGKKTNAARGVETTVAGHTGGLGSVSLLPTPHKTRLPKPPPGWRDKRPQETASVFPGFHPNSPPADGTTDSLVRKPGQGSGGWKRYLFHSGRSP